MTKTIKANAEEIVRECVDYIYNCYCEGEPVGEYLSDIVNNPYPAILSTGVFHDAIGEFVSLKGGYIITIRTDY